MSKSLGKFLSTELQNLEAAGLLQEGAIVGDAKGCRVKIGTKEVVSFASDNYLGWAGDPRFKKAAVLAIEECGLGFSSSRVVTGTHARHKRLESSIAKFLSMEDAILYSSGYQANLGMIECLFSEQDYLFCDYSLHPSTVDGIRLSSARHFVFRSQDLSDLEDKLKRSANARFRAIITEGVTASDGRLCPLKEIVELARRFDAIVIVDDSHGIGVLGAHGKGITEYHDLLGKADLVTGSLGHALGAGGGGFACGRKEIVGWLRQKSRAYLFSGSLQASTLGAAANALELLQQGAPEVQALWSNIEHFRSQLNERGFEAAPSVHPIVSILVRDAVVAQKMANKLLAKGFFVLGYCYPVVARGQAQIRMQLSALHSKKELDEALDALSEAGKSLKVTR